MQRYQKRTDGRSLNLSPIVSIASVAIIITMNIFSSKSHYRVNLLRLQQRCESNYARLKQLLPDTSRDTIYLPIAPSENNHQCIEWITVDVLERAPYTTRLRLTMNAQWGEYVRLPDLTVCLYHDVRMAEVVSRASHQIIQPQYEYPNQHMHQPDEKEQLNQFLTQWLDYLALSYDIPIKNVQ